MYCDYHFHPTDWKLNYIQCHSVILGSLRRITSHRRETEISQILAPKNSYKRTLCMASKIIPYRKMFLSRISRIFHPEYTCTAEQRYNGH